MWPRRSSWRTRPPTTATRASPSTGRVTWVSEATTAGGLYVGATRGRYRQHAARGRRRRRGRPPADHHGGRAGPGRPGPRRGPHPGRGRGGRRPGRPERPVPPRAFDPADWRTVAELDAAARKVEARLASGLRTLQEVAVIPDDQRQRDNQADRAAAAEARQRAAWHRAEAERIAAGRDQLVDTAIADYFAARDDARIIAAGPGLLGRKAHQVEAAQARRDETARRWAEPQLPGSAWTDQAVRQAAAVGRRADRRSRRRYQPGRGRPGRTHRHRPRPAGHQPRPPPADRHRNQPAPRPPTRRPHRRRRSRPGHHQPPPPSPSPASRHHDPRPGRGRRPDPHRLPGRTSPPTPPRRPTRTDPPGPRAGPDTTTRRTRPQHRTMSAVQPACPLAAGQGATLTARPSSRAACCRRGPMLAGVPNPQLASVGQPSGEALGDQQVHPRCGRPRWRPRRAVGEDREPAAPRGAGSGWHRRPPGWLRRTAARADRPAHRAAPATAGSCRQCALAGRPSSSSSGSPSGQRARSTRTARYS